MLLSVVTGSCKAGPVEASMPGVQESCLHLLGEPAAQFGLHLESLWGAKQQKAKAQLPHISEDQETKMSIGSKQNQVITIKSHLYSSMSA
ncbi:hypothetical protein STEG23_002630, partial [Scotinomys teguina]